MAGTYTRRINLYINGSEVRANIASVKEEMRRLINEQNRMTIGSREYVAHGQKIRQLQGVLNQHRAGLRDLGSVWERLGRTIGRNIRSMMFAFTAIAGGGLSIRKAIESFNALEDSIAGVSSLTGLTGENLDWLANRAKQLSTEVTESGVRITASAKDIMDGFGLIGSQRPELLKDKEALAEVTEAALILAAAGRIQLEPAARAITGTMNQMGLGADEATRIINALAAGSQAGAADIAYLNQVIERTGTISKNLDIPFEELIGTIEAIAPKFTSAEEASTQLRNVLLIMGAGADATNPKVVGLNKAIDELAKQELSLGQLRERFGRGNVNMAASLIENRKEIERFTKAVTGTNQAIEQGIINTNTNSAMLAQSRNELTLVSAALGEKLSPMITKGISGFAGLLKVIGSTIGFLVKNRDVFMALAVSIGFYAIATGAAAIAAKAKAAATWLMAKAQAAYQAVLNVNLLHLMATAIFISVIAINRYTRGLSEAEKEQRALNKARAEGDKQTARSRVELEQLFRIAQNEKLSLDRRREAIKAINRISPEYLGNISLETVNTDKARLAKEEYLKTLAKEARTKAIMNQLQEIEEKIIETQMAGPAGLMNLWDHIIDHFGDRAEMKFEKIMDGLKGQKEALLKFLQADDVMLKSFLGGGLAGDVDEDVEPTGTSGKTYSVAADQQFQTQLLNLKKAFQEGIIKTEAEFQKAALDLEILFLEARLAKNIDSGNDLLTLENQLADKRLQSHKANLDRLNQIERAIESPLEREKREHNERLAALGLFGISKEAMTEKELLAVEALEKQHRENLANIETQAMQKDIDQRQLQFETGLIDMQLQHAKEVETFKGNAKELDDLKEKQRKKETDFVRKHLEKLLADLTAILESGEFEGIDLTNALLSEEALADLQKRINAIKKELAGLMPGSPDNEFIPNELRGQYYDIFGFTQDDWDKFFENLENGVHGINEIKMAADALFSIWSDFNKLASAVEQKRLAEYEKSNKEQQDSLSARLQAGLISQEYYHQQQQKLTEELDRKKAEAARKQARREKALALMSAIVNTAAAVVKALPNIPLSILVGLAGALQIATIAATPIPGLQQGGFMNVTRAGDGKAFRAVYSPRKRGYINRPTVLTGDGGREYVIPAEGLKNPSVRTFVEALELARINGSLPSLNLDAIKQTLPGRQQGGFVQAQAMKPASQTIQPGNIGSFLELNLEVTRKNSDAIEALNKRLREPLIAEVALTGRKGIIEKEKEYETLLQNANL